MSRKLLATMVSLLVLFKFQVAYGEVTKLIVAYASQAATFCPGWIAKREGIFAKHSLDVEMVLMQGASTYMPALASGNIQVLYGGGTAVSRAIATGGFDLAVIATETRYVPLRMMVNASIQTAADLKGKKLGAGLQASMSTQPTRAARRLRSTTRAGTASAPGWRSASASATWN